MNQRGECFQSFHFSLVALVLHGLDGNHAVPLGGVASEDFPKGSLAEDAVWIQVEVVGQFQPGEQLAWIDLRHLIFDLCNLFMRDKETA